MHYCSFACAVLQGPPSRESVTVLENGLQFNVPLIGGQKTGFYAGLVHQPHAARCQDLAAVV